MAFLKQHSTPTFQLVIHVYGPDGEKPKKLVKTQWLLAGYLDVFDLLRRHPHPDRFLYQVISSVGRSFIAPALYASGSTCKFCKHPVVRMWSHLAKITRREVTIKSLPLCGDPACLQSEKFKDFLREIQQDVNVPACVCVSCGNRAAQNPLPCPGCKVACYCSPKCEKQHRTEHKRLCLPSKYAGLCSDV